MNYYKAIQDIPQFNLKIGDELKSKDGLTFNHLNGLSMPLPLMENMVNTGLFEKIEDDTVINPTTISKAPRIMTNLSLDDELDKLVNDFILSKDQGSNFIVNSPIGEYLKKYIDRQDAGQSIKDNGLYHLGSIKTKSQYDINIYVDPYMDWTELDCKIITGDITLDLSKYYKIFKKDE